MSIETELDNIDKLLGSKTRGSQEGFLEIAQSLCHIARKQNLELLQLGRKQDLELRKLQDDRRKDAVANKKSMEALTNAVRPVDSVDGDTLEDVAREVSQGGSTHLTAPSNFADQEDPTPE